MQILTEKENLKERGQSKIQKTTKKGSGDFIKETEKGFLKSIENTVNPIVIKADHA